MIPPSNRKLHKAKVREFSNVEGTVLEEHATTVMLRGFPRNFDIPMLLDEMKLISGPMSLCYDFICLPWEVRRRTNLSIAFINFIDHADAKACFDFFDGRVLYGGKTSVRPFVCRAFQSHIQGLVANLSYYYAKGGQDALYSPYAAQVFEHGKRVENLWVAVAKYVTEDSLMRAMQLLNAESPEEADDTSSGLATTSRASTASDQCASLVSPSPEFVRNMSANSTYAQFPFPPNTAQDFQFSGAVEGFMNLQTQMFHLPSNKSRIRILSTQVMHF